jgi:arabinan endo-1,5-alpha-L-arabinosidase
VFCTGPGILTRHSIDLQHWEAGPRVFTNAPAWIAQTVPANRGDYWAPDIIEWSNRFLLYYSVSTWGSRNSAIALATNATLDVKDPTCHWVDQGPVIQTTETDNFNAIDPAVVHDAQNRLWLVFGSYWSGIKLIELNPATGFRLTPNSPVISLACNTSIEASAICRHGDFYYLFVNWGQCCKGVDSTYEIRVGRSPAITGPFVDQNGLDLLYEGGTPFLSTDGRYIGPGHAAFFTRNAKEYLSCHYYDGTRQGKASLAITPLLWTTNGWPMANLSQTNLEFTTP